MRFNVIALYLVLNGQGSSAFLGSRSARGKRLSKRHAMSEFRSDGSKLNINEVGGGKDRQDEIEVKIARFKAAKNQKANSQAFERKVSTDTFEGLFDFDTGKRVPAVSKTQGSAAQIASTQDALTETLKEMRGGAGWSEDPNAGFESSMNEAENFFNKGPKMKPYVKPVTGSTLESE